MKSFRSALLALFVALTACDSFSVLDEYQVPTSGPKVPPLTLALKTSTLPQNGTTDLVASGGVPPYEYVVLADGAESPGTLGSTSTAPAQFTAGTSVGTFRVRAIDSLGNTADASVKVRPPAPTSLTVTYSGSPPKNTLTWSYPSTDYITGFRLESSSDSGSTYLPLATPGKGTSSEVHQGGSVQGSYYRLYAVFETIDSLPAEAN